uniref:Putative secreted protein n=1 Tax=Ixodes ricinus TaxID=34613 RepID=A0A6B0UFE9_IXORI
MCIFMCSLLYLHLFAETVSECASIFEHILLFLWQLVGGHLRRIQTGTKGSFFSSIHDICANVRTQGVTFLNNIFLILNIIYVMQTS